MSDKKIIVDALDWSSWLNLENEIQAYSFWLRERAAVFAERCAEEGVKIADMNFQNAVYAGAIDVRCRVTNIKNDGTTYQATIEANGETVLFIEFGSGLAFANSYQFEHGFAPGQYGHHQGLNPKGWLYSGSIGTNPPFGTEPSIKKKGMIHTYGNPANESLGQAINELETRIAKIASEVFG